MTLNIAFYFIQCFINSLFFRKTYFSVRKMQKSANFGKKWSTDYEHLCRSFSKKKLLSLFCCKIIAEKCTLYTTKSVVWKNKINLDVVVSSKYNKISIFDSFECLFSQFKIQIDESIRRTSLSYFTLSLFHANQNILSLEMLF